jgi:hypothetical protein
VAAVQQQQQQQLATGGFCGTCILSCRGLLMAAAAWPVAELVELPSGSSSSSACLPLLLLLHLHKQLLLPLVSAATTG